ncbi:CMRF35-like molecule 2 [Cheilinus undulatus]|uniref:CMRF35-like molecule 2 n=1 Tax=Cheilinus undulatus TaxID=241271 RepID=UPI001BD31796|nr:CMRF35-like molecule 2 [Cheilinus undulatus]
MALQISCLLILTGLTGIFSISIVKRVTVKAGDSVSIPCLYEAKYKNHVKYLCKGWYHCSSIVKTSQQNSQRFSISDEKEQRVFTVTINNLTNEDMDDYWCAVEINGQVDDKAHFHLSASGNPYLYVDDQWITAYEGDNITIKCFNHYGGLIWMDKWNKSVHH